MKWSLLSVVSFLLLDGFVTGRETTNVNSCNDGSILPDVQIIGANNTLCVDPPCPVKPGSDVSMDIIFKSPRYLENITPDIKVTALGVNLDYPLGQDNACDGIINTYCPLVKNEKIEYVYSMHLLEIFPEITATLEVSIIDKDSDTNVICFTMEIEVVK